MFYNVSETNEALEVMEQTIGPRGRMIATTDKDTVYFNAGLCTQEDGKIWYGDLNFSEIEKVREVAKKINKTLYIIPDSNELIPTGKGWHMSALQEVRP